MTLSSGPTGDIKKCLLEFPDATFTQLYQQPATCLAIFRLLPPLSKQFVMRMLFLPPHSLMTSEISSWARDHDTSLLAIEGARRFKILKEAGDGLWKLDESFRRHFQCALTGSGAASSFGSLAGGVDRQPVDIPFLDSYAKQQWETLLRFMVGTLNVPKPNRLAIQILESSGLMIKKSAEIYEITYRGFQFLLQDVNSQVWVLMLQYMSMVTHQDTGMTEVDVLSFMFLLSSMELGAGYSTDTLCDTQQAVLDDLVNMGIVYRRKKKSSRFYPTSLVTTLTNGKIAIHQTDGKVQGFILLETNFRIYAYTASELQISILRLFVQITTRFPNFVIGIISRESMLAAFKKGITAEQIISFLYTNAHPLMQKGNSKLPVTVLDQMRLWENETHRFKSEKGRLIISFRRQDQFDFMCQYAAKLNAKLFSNCNGSKDSWVLVVREDSYLLILDAYKRWRDELRSAKSSGDAALPANSIRHAYK